MRFIRRFLRTAALILIAGPLSLLIISDTDRLLKTERRNKAFFRGLFVKNLPADRAPRSCGSLPDPVSPPGTGERVICYRNADGKPALYAFFGSSGLSRFAVIKRESTGVRILQYRLDPVAVALEDVFSRKGFRERTFFKLSSGSRPFLSAVHLSTAEGTYRITPCAVRFTPFRKDGTLTEAVRAASLRTGVPPQGLLPFRMGSDVVFLEVTGGCGSRYLHIHPNERTAFSALRAFLRRYRGQGMFFLGKAEMPLSRRDRYFPFSVGWRKFYFDPNRIFSPKALFREFLRARIFYRYAGYNRWYFFRKNEKSFREGLGILRRVILAFFLTRPEPVVIVHDNKSKMGWSEAILKGQYSTSYSAARRVRGQRLSDFVLVTDKADYGRLLSSGFNVLLQSAKTPPQDGSASVAFASMRKRYFCIEAGRDSGNSRRGQRIILQMLETVRRMRYSGRP